MKEEPKHLFYVDYFLWTRDATYCGLLLAHDEYALRTIDQVTCEDCINAYNLSLLTELQK